MRLIKFAKLSNPFVLSSLACLSVCVPLLLAYFFKPLPAQAAGESWLDGYGYRRQITIDNTKVSDLDSADFSNFPVLISLSGLSHIKDGGADVRFTASDGTTQLAREIESYSTSTLVTWVRVPTLDYDNDTVIYMYYGNDAADEPAADSDYGSQKV